MTIRTPTSLVLDFNIDLKTEIASNKFATHRFISNTTQLPFGSYAVGSIDLTSDMGTVTLGTAGAGVIQSNRAISVILGEDNPIHTKLFAYDGNKMPISISTTSLSPITVEYVLGDRIPTVPSAPVLISVSPDINSVSVAFFESEENGGSPITGYTVTSYPEGITATGTTSPIEVTGLTNGTSYTFAVVATNVVGDSIESNISESVVPTNPATVPDAPTIVDISMNDRAVSLYFDEPVNDGGSPITEYLAESTPGGLTGTSTTSPVVVENLEYGTQYTFVVYAINDVGQSVSSNVSDPETPIGFPEAPVITDATISHTTATISFTTPNTNGSTITEYAVLTSPGNGVTTGPSSPIDITGLQPGTDYTFIVIAVTPNGNGLQSAPSATLTATA